MKPGILGENGPDPLGTRGRRLPQPGAVCMDVYEIWRFWLASGSGILRRMHDIPERIADVLLAVEATLRTSGKWEASCPPAEDLVSPEPFCLDTLRFEQWLQWVFLPRMKQILEQNRPLPEKSGIFVYAQESLPKLDPPSDNLLALITRFDELIPIQSGVRRH